MKTINSLVIIIALFIVQTTNIQAQSFKLKSYKLTVSGTSTMHDWESNAEKVDFKGIIKLTDNMLVDIQAAVVKVPVVSIKSTKGKIMDNKTYDAFDYEKNPNIIFTLNSAKINTNTSTVDMKGTLAMAGATRPVDITARYKVLQNGEVQFTGSKKLKMTDFKMEPPTAMMGAIKVGDDITVNFDIVTTISNEISRTK